MSSINLPDLQLQHIFLNFYKYLAFYLGQNLYLLLFSSSRITSPPASSRIRQVVTATRCDVTLRCCIWTLWRWCPGCRCRRTCGLWTSRRPGSRCSLWPSGRPRGWTGASPPTSASASVRWAPTLFRFRGF